MLRESGPRPCHNLIPRRRQRHARIFLRACSVLKQSIDPRVVLIDGHQLAEYMLDLSLGVTSRAMYELKRIDSDYFAEE